MVVIFAKDDWRGFSTWLAMFEQKLDHPQLINLFYLGIFHKRTEASTKDLEKMLLAFLKVHRDVFLSCERMTLLVYLLSISSYHFDHNNTQYQNLQKSSCVRKFKICQNFTSVKNFSSIQVHTWFEYLNIYLRPTPSIAQRSVLVDFVSK